MVLDAKQLGDFVLINVRSNDAKTTDDRGRSGSNVSLAGDVIEMDPFAILASYDALSAQYDAILKHILQLVQTCCNFVLGEFFCCFTTEAFKNFVCMMVMMLMIVLMIMRTAAGTPLLMFVMVVMLMVVVMLVMMLVAVMMLVLASAVAIFIVMMMLMMVIATTVTVFIMMMVLMMVITTAIAFSDMVMIVRQTIQFCFNGVLALHSLKQLRP